jgi:glycosyltransferase involved in cell wall biosynthesis
VSGGPAERRLPRLSRMPRSKGVSLRVLLFIEGPDAPTSHAVSARRVPGYLALVADDIDLRLLTRGRPALLHERVAKLGIPAAGLACDPRWLLPVAVFKLANQMRVERYDIVQAHEPMQATVAGLARRLAFSRARLIYVRHHTRGGRSRFRALALTYLSRLAARLADLTFADSRAVADIAVQDDRTDPDRVRVVYPGVADLRAVQTDEVRNLRDRLGIDENTPVVGAVSRLRKEKGLDVLIDAAALSAARHDPLSVVIVGSGAEEHQLRSQADKHGHKMVHFAGHQDDIALWYALMDVVALPSRREAAPRTAMEALAAGKPLVASRVGGLPEIAERSVGLLVPPNDPQALLEAILSLTTDLSRARAMGHAGRRRYESLFTQEQMVERWRSAWMTLSSAGSLDPPVTHVNDA